MKKRIFAVSCVSDESDELYFETITMKDRDNDRNMCVDSEYIVMCRACGYKDVLEFCNEYFDYSGTDPDEDCPAVNEIEDAIEAEFLDSDYISRNYEEYIDED